MLVLLRSSEYFLGTTELHRTFRQHEGEWRLNVSLKQPPLQVKIYLM